jgi:hypothetical protein
MSNFNEKKRRRSIIVIGFLLIIFFIFPTFKPVHFNTGKLVFENIELLGESDLITILILLYPLIAGIIVLFVGLKVNTILRPNVILACGFLPFIMAIFRKDAFIIDWTTRGGPVKASLIIFVVLLLIGVFIGLKVASRTKHFSGRLIGGISGVLFLIFVLLPIKSSTPIFFALFTFFKSVNRAREVFIVIELVVIFSCYIFAAIISILNLLGTLSSNKITSIAFKLVFYVTLAFPISIFILLLFSDIIDKWYLLTVLIQSALLFGGIIGMIGTGLLDLIYQTQPGTIGIEPDSHEASTTKALLSNLVKHKEALKAYEKEIEIKPDDHKAWYNKGVTLGILGRHDEALNAYNKAIEIKPDLHIAWTNKGVTLRKLFRLDEALEAYNKAIEIKPDYHKTLYNLACVYSLKKDKGKALECLQKAIDKGYNNISHIKKDNDLDFIRNEKEFQEIISKI